MTENFWYWLVSGLLEAMFFFMNLFPHHYDWGLSQLFLTDMAMSILMILSLVGAFVHLQTFFALILLVVPLEGVRGLFALYKWFKDLNPVAP